MKFLALTALVATASAIACTDAEIAEDPPKCTVTTAAVEDDVATADVDETAAESIDCVEETADTICDDTGEEEASSALFASLASAAVAVTMMF
tara:strand:- start:278 stop:556 length:279 start_codon:yes stop_codon:yes gene_type:complete